MNMRLSVFVGFVARVVKMSLFLVRMNQVTSSFS